MGNKVLFLINGLGLGNSTRCHAIIEELLSFSCEIAIVTSGNGIWYFNQHIISDKVYEIPQINYVKKNNQIDVLQTMMSAPSMINLLSKNEKILENIIENFNPNIVVADSVYTLKPIKKFGLPIVHINNADVVVFNQKEFGLPMSVQFQFQAIERLDYYFHKYNSDLVISPSLDITQPILHKSIKRVPVIVRSGLKLTQRTKAQKAIIMLSGSTFGTQISLEKSNFSFPIIVVGKTNKQTNTSSNNIKFVGKVSNSFKYINSTNLAVVNGGFSAVSEMFFRRCPMVVVPIPRHSEQYVNAKMIERLGIGLMATEDNLNEKLKELAIRSKQFHDAYDSILPDENGAKIAAKAILNLKR